MLVPSRKLCPSTSKFASSTETNNKQENSSIKLSTTGVNLKDSPTNNGIMNDTYIVPCKSDKQKHVVSNEDSQDNEIRTSAIDYGYQSKETDICSSNETINKEPYLAHELPGELKKQCSITTESKGIGSGLDVSRSFSISKLNSTENCFSHCQQGQCNQCMLDTLWKNRIREGVGNSVNVEEYNKLKNKLLLVFQGDLFEKIYLSLLQDWEGKETSLNSSINNYIKDLNYEQVQNLPLMMQFIQLNVHNKLK